MDQPEPSEIDIDEVKQKLSDEAWLSLVGVGVGYGLILAVILVLLFLIPYLLFTLF